MRIEVGRKLDFKDVLIRPKRTSLGTRRDVSLRRTFKFVHAAEPWTGVPIIAANMDTTGTFSMARVLSRHEMLTAIQVGKQYSLADWESFASQAPDSVQWVVPTIGMRDSDAEALTNLLSVVRGVRMVCLDVANGYTEQFISYVKKFRKLFPEKVLIAGNVCTPEMTEELILSGADVVKVGIGPGSVCTTRKMTGVGYPQLSAVVETADAAHGLNGRIISDGGCTVPGDVAKAFGAGADFVMLGGMLAGHDESGGELVERNGRQFKLFYGMSSDTAMNKYHGGVAQYRASEGKTVTLPYRGPVEATILSVLGGLRSTCTYVGASELRELSKRTTFVHVSQQINDIYSHTDFNNH